MCGVEAAARRGDRVDRNLHVGSEAVLLPVGDDALGNRVRVADVGAVLVLVVDGVAGLVGDRVVVLVGGLHRYAVGVGRRRVRIRLVVDRDARHVADERRRSSGRSWSRSCSRDPTRSRRPPGEGGSTAGFVKSCPISDDPTTWPFASFTSEPSALCLKSTWSASVVPMP